MISTRRTILMIAVFIMFLPVSFAPLTASLSQAGTVDLPWTGQTTSYAAGDDGAIQAGVPWPTPRFTDNGDGTVTDNLTGLMWLKDAWCLRYKPTSRPWEFALDQIADFNANPGKPHCQGYIANYTDWRLPNVNELESLVNAEQANSAAWLNSQGFINVQGWYWSSTTFANRTDDAWGVFMWSGYWFYLPKGSSGPFVWPVRAGGLFGDSVISAASVWKTGQTESYAQGDDGSMQMGVSWPTPRFTDNGDGTVTDNLTGLMWLKDANCINTNYPDFDKGRFPRYGDVLWQHSLDFVKGINAGPYSRCGAGYMDWRLPNKKELYSLTDFSRYELTLPSGHPFINVQFSPYWSSTTLASLTASAWYVRMLDGLGNFSNKKDLDDGLYVWPVRAGGLFGSSVISTSTTTSIPTTTTSSTTSSTTSTTIPAIVELTENATIADTSFPGVPGPAKTADSPDVSQILSTPMPGNIGLSVDIRDGKQAVEIFFWVEGPGIPKTFLFFDKARKLSFSETETSLGRFVISENIAGIPIFGPPSLFFPGGGIFGPAISVSALPKGDYKVVLEFRDGATGTIVTTSTVTFNVK